MVNIGVEVTIGGIVFVLHDCDKSNYCKLGWVVTFLMIVREGGPSSGYVSTGFFGGKHLMISMFPRVELLFFPLGLTLGRVILVEVTKKVIFLTIPGESND